MTAPNTVAKCPKCGTSLRPDNWFRSESTGDKYHFLYCENCDEHFEDRLLNLRITAQNLMRKED